MRRKLIFPHRGVRSMPLSRLRLSAALLVALLLTVCTYWFRAYLLDVHNQISASLLSGFDIPIESTTQVDVFPPIGSASVVTTPNFLPGEQPLRILMMFVAAMVALLLVHRFVPLARSFIVFQIVILAATAGIIFVVPGSEVTSAEFSQIWLRSEVLVWFLLPWVSASVLVILQNKVWPGVFWAVSVQVYGFVWSAIRLAFCLGVLHFSGLLFMPLLWFALGLLADVLYIVVFLSLSVRDAGMHAWGGRASWQF